MCESLQIVELAILLVVRVLGVVVGVLLSDHLTDIVNAEQLRPKI